MTFVPQGGCPKLDWSTAVGAWFGQISRFFALNRPNYHLKGSKILPQTDIALSRSRILDSLLTLVSPFQKLFSIFFKLHGARSYARLIKSMDDDGPRRCSRHQLNDLQPPSSLFFYYFPKTWLLLTKGLGFSTHFCPPAFKQPRL